MAEIINLRKARKRLARQSREKQAEENRMRHGRTRADKIADAAKNDGEKRFLDGHLQVHDSDRHSEPDDI